MKAVGYVRCSTHGQVLDGETIERQTAMIKERCKAKGIELVEIIKDEGISGFKSTRPGFKKLQEMCRSKRIDMVIVYDLSRLSRSVRDTLNFIEDVLQKNSVHFTILTQDIDTSTPSGLAFLTISSVFNQLYRDEISFKTKIAIRHKKDKGERFSGEVPYGFEENADGKLVPSKSDQKLLRMVAELKTQGLSLRKIGEVLEEKGIKTKSGKTSWNPKTISALLSLVTHGP